MSGKETWMDDSRRNEPSHLFLVRVWLGRADDTEDVWEGKVQHVYSGKAYSFSGWPSLVAVLTDLASGAESVHQISEGERQ
ncbi:MAG: hypothetical protein ACR2M0_00270 [Chloroflexia bacterium]